MSNLEKLTKAGIVDPNHLSDAEKKTVESLSDDEVNCLISVKGKAQAAGIAAAPKII